MSRTNVDIDDRLIRRARRLTGLKTKKAVIHRALETLVRTEDRKGILRYYGSGVWQGDLKKMRRSRIS
jgi:Arc/MetJ family transcription regulator